MGTATALVVGRGNSRHVRRVSLCACVCLFGKLFERHSQSFGVIDYGQDADSGERPNGYVLMPE